MSVEQLLSTIEKLAAERNALAAELAKAREAHFTVCRTRDNLAAELVKALEVMEKARERISALRACHRRSMNDAAARAEMAADDMAEVSIASTESERHREAFTALNVAIGILDNMELVSDSDGSVSQGTTGVVRDPTIEERQ